MFRFTLILTLLLGRSAIVQSGDLAVGAAMVKITPPLGIPLAGYYHERGSSGVHDDLFARAIVMEKDGTKAAVVSLDLISTRRDFVEEARRLIELETEIPGKHVMISATHAHTGPVLSSTSRRIDSKGPVGALIARYSEEVPGMIAKAVAEANRRLIPARASAVIGHEDSIAFNRRFHMKDGSVGWNPGKLNPGIIKPAGPIDPEVPVVFFSSIGGDPIAAYVNYAVHLDNVGGLEISADVPFTLSQLLARIHGPEMVSVFTAGTCGDVNHINVQWRAPQKGNENAARMGIILAGAVLRAWPNLEAVNGPLSVRSEMVDLALPEITAGEIEESKRIVETTLDNTRENFMKLVNAHKILDVAERAGKPLSVEVQVIALGGRLAWVGLPGEIFVQLGLDLKLDSPVAQTMVAELANGSIGYIPNVRAYSQGNYEVVSARCAAGSGEKLVQTAVRLLKEIYAESN